MIKDNKGLTLIEVVLSMAIFSIVIAIAYSTLNFANVSHKSTQTEFEIQAEMRLAAESVNRIIRDATAVFAVTEAGFQQDNLKQGWSYFGVSQDRKEIVHYQWAKDSTGAYRHVKTPIVTKKDHLSYNMFFKKVANSNKLLEFTLEGYVDENSKQKVTINSQLEAINAQQVVDRGDDSNYAVAIAYRNDDRPTPEIETIEGGDAGKIAVTMVLDVSGSMNGDMYGRNRNPKRIDILQREAIKMIEGFSEMENVYVCLIPFSTSANFPGNAPKKFLKPSNASDKNKLIREIQNLQAYGGTNIGDGMRRAYWQLSYFNNQQIGNQVSNHMILLVDGDPTFASVTPQTDRVRNRQWPGYNEYWSTRTSNYSNPEDFRLTDGNVDQDTFLHVIDRRNNWIGWGRYQEEIRVGSTNNFSKNHNFNYNNPGWVPQPNRNAVELGLYGNEVIGTGQTGLNNIENNMKYVNYVGEKLILNGNLDIETFVIGFTAVPDEVERAQEIANICQGKYYRAGDAVELEQVFEEITNVILDAQWHIYGP